MKTAQLFHLALCAALAGCASGQTQQTNREPTGDGSAIVVRGSEIAGNLLEGLRTRIPAMRVSTPTGECPRIVFRGPRSIRNQGNPSVYVDGTLMRDTCVLAQISASDVDHVEVYPSGISSRVDVQRNPFGLILVYRLRG
jgi:hypothetical protein